MKSKWSLFTLGFCGILLPLAVCAAPRQQSAQGAQPADQSSDVNPVVAAARKAREQKAAQQNKTAKVYTNEDLSSIKGGGVSVVGAPEAAPAAQNADKGAAAEGGDKTAAGAAAQTPGAAGPKDEAAWRGRFAAARRALADDTRELDILQRELNLKEQQYYSDPNQALREQYDRKDLDDTQAKIDAKKEAIEKDQQGIRDLEDDLRKAGGDPGWALDPNPAPENPAQPPSDGQPAQP